MAPFETNLTPPLEIEGVTPPKKSGFLGSFNALLKHFSPSERLFLYVLAIVLGVSSFVLLAEVNTMVSTEVPTRGGTLVEGAIGTPRFVNPLLAVSQPDQDLTTLVYSGLLRATQDGNYIPDLAESYDISEEGTVYTFHLRKNLTFHDGEPLTAADVLFTIHLAQQPDIKSSRRADWDGVQVASPDEHTVVFTLPHAYAPFRENATMGILPKHVWESVTADEFPFSSLNTHPVGSGPYAVRSVVEDATGAPAQYELRSFPKFALGTPHITTIRYVLFSNGDDLMNAYEQGDIDSFVATSPKNLPRALQESETLHRLLLARTFGVFFNQNHATILTHAEVRRALTLAVDAQSIIDRVLGGYGTSLDSPIPEMHVAARATSTDDRIEAARAILVKNGWKFNTASTTAETGGTWSKGKETLALTLETADAEELVTTAQTVAEAWRALGVPTTVHIYPLSEFNQNILRPRQYDAIVFGEVVGRSLDLFAFWHSSQRNDPGLNLALYTSQEADKTLAAARSETDTKKRTELLQSFVTTVADDMPAIFLYAPQAGYVLPSRIQGIHFGTLTTAADRFTNVYEWYRDTERIWNVFSH